LLRETHPNLNMLAGRKKMRRNNDGDVAENAIQGQGCYGEMESRWHSCTAYFQCDALISVSDHFIVSFLLSIIFTL
jgi:hypothetical protein